jgi:hypothetical protein
LLGQRTDTGVFQREEIQSNPDLFIRQGRMLDFVINAFGLVSCGCFVFCQPCPAVRFSSLGASLVLPDMLPGLKWNVPGSFSPDCFWFGFLLFATERSFDCQR